MDKIIKSIRTSIAPFFNENERIFFSKESYGFYTFGSNNQSEAYNYHKNDRDVIRAVKWFDDYWIFMKICFAKINIEQNLSSDAGKPSNKISLKDYLNKLSENQLRFGNDFFQTLITISLFEGDHDPENKIQLFRAEWDNFNESTAKHPQPHWHFYPSNLHVENSSSFQPSKEEGFTEAIKIKRIDLRRFHFAMNENWANSSGHFHRISNKNDLVNWYHGLLKHIKTQLEYVK